MDERPGIHLSAKPPDMLWYAQDEVEGDEGPDREQSFEEDPLQDFILDERPGVHASPAPPPMLFGSGSAPPEGGDPGDGGGGGDADLQSVISMSSRPGIKISPQPPSMLLSSGQQQAVDPRFRGDEARSEYSMDSRPALRPSPEPPRMMGGGEPSSGVQDDALDEFPGTKISPQPPSMLWSGQGGYAGGAGMALGSMAERRSSRGSQGSDDQMDEGESFAFTEDAPASGIKVSPAPPPMLWQSAGSALSSAVGSMMGSVRGSREGSLRGSREGSLLPSRDGSARESRASSFGGADLDAPQRPLGHDVAMSSRPAPELVPDVSHFQERELTALSSQDGSSSWAQNEQAADEEAAGPVLRSAAQPPLPPESGRPVFAPPPRTAPPVIQSL